MDPGPVSARGKIAGREAVAIHPEDAQRRRIADGDLVRVFNARGACLAGAEVTEAVRPGVVRLSLRRLVRSRQRCRGRALRPWQCQCPDARLRHLAPRPRPELGHRHGRDRALDRGAAAAPRLHAAGGRRRIPVKARPPRRVDQYGVLTIRPLASTYQRSLAKVLPCSRACIQSVSRIGGNGPRLAAGTLPTEWRES